MWNNPNPIIFGYCMLFAPFTFFAEAIFRGQHLFLLIMVAYGTLVFSEGMEEVDEGLPFGRMWMLLGILIISYGMFGVVSVSPKISKPALTLAFVILGLFNGCRKP